MYDCVSLSVIDLPLPSVCSPLPQAAQLPTSAKRDIGNLSLWQYSLCGPSTVPEALITFIPRLGEKRQIRLMEIVLGGRWRSRHPD